MNRILLFLILGSIGWNNTLFLNPTCMPFDYARDMSVVRKLLKTEWPKLFLSPSYDENLVQKMFYKKQPGDVSVTNTTLNIKVLYDDSRLVGFITYYSKKNQVGHIELLAVDATSRNKGHGTFLIDTITQEFKKSECLSLQLYVYTSNPRAITYYEHLGFTLKANFGAYLLLSKKI